jgi:hypothetical protein
MYRPAAFAGNKKARDRWSRASRPAAGVFDIARYPGGQTDSAETLMVS